MRLLATFVALLVLGSAAMSISWDGFGLARDGETGARIAVLVSGGVAFLSLVLLARIVYRISRPRGLGEDS
ncbi:MAG: hypothetical protein HYX53_08410 [Chloroflexi bacterium]|nr:hypothetical protein [Chloroflexota bacterium]